MGTRALIFIYRLNYIAFRITYIIIYVQLLFKYYVSMLTSYKYSLYTTKLVFSCFCAFAVLLCVCVCVFRKIKSPKNENVRLLTFFQVTLCNDRN